MGTTLDIGKLQKMFGEAVRKIRESRTDKMSQEVLAEKIGVDRSYMGFIERGERNITLDKIGKLAEALEVKIEELFRR